MSRKHNPKTRYYNSKHKPVVWGTAVKTVKRKGKLSEVEYDVTVPYDQLYDPDVAEKADAGRAQYPFDTLSLNWLEEAIHWAADKGYKISREELAPGYFRYTAVNTWTKKVELTVDSPRNMVFNTAVKTRGSK